MDYIQTTNFIGDWVRALGLPAGLDRVVNGLLGAATIAAVVMGGATLLVWVERKVSALIQSRLGPMRVGPWGILQSVADVMKLLFKEILVPTGADRLVYFLAPMLPLTAAFMVLAVIPFGPTLQVANPDLGVPYLIAMGGIGVLGILIGGWASNNKFSLLGSLRSGAQMVSYEISVALILLFITLVSGTTDLRTLVLTQQGTILDWWVFKMPGLGFFAFILYLISSTAELNRAPFDIAEAEQELAAGYHTEYSGMGFAMFFLAEYGNLIASAGVAATCFLGGFLPPAIGVASVDRVLFAVPGVVWFALKVAALILGYMWFRWTFPRPRVDQLMALEWKFLLPLNLGLLSLGAIFTAMGWVLP